MVTGCMACSVFGVGAVCGVKGTSVLRPFALRSAFCVWLSLHCCCAVGGAVAGGGGAL